MRPERTAFGIAVKPTRANSGNAYQAAEIQEVTAQANVTIPGTDVLTE